MDAGSPSCSTALPPPEPRWPDPPQRSALVACFDPRGAASCGGKAQDLPGDLRGVRSRPHMRRVIVARRLLAAGRRATPQVHSAHDVDCGGGGGDTTPGAADLSCAAPVRRVPRPTRVGGPHEKPVSHRIDLEGLTADEGEEAEEAGAAACAGAGRRPPLQRQQHATALKRHDGVGGDDDYEDDEDGAATASCASASSSSSSASSCSSPSSSVSRSTSSRWFGPDDSFYVEEAEEGAIFGVKRWSCGAVSRVRLPGEVLPGRLRRAASASSFSSCTSAARPLRASDGGGGGGSGGGGDGGWQRLSSGFIAALVRYLEAHGALGDKDGVVGRLAFVWDVIVWFEGRQREGENGKNGEAAA